MRVDPFFRAGSIEILSDVNQVIVLDSEIVESRNVNVIDLLRRERFRFELFSHGAFQGERWNHFDGDVPAGVDLLTTVNSYGPRSFGQILGSFRFEGVVARGRRGQRHLVLCHAIFAEKSFVFHTGWGR